MRSSGGRNEDFDQRIGENSVSSVQLHFEVQVGGYCKVGKNCVFSFHIAIETIVGLPREAERAKF